MNSAIPEDVVQRQIGYYNAGDIEGFLSVYAHDAVLARFPEGTVIARGRDEMRRIYSALFRDNPSLHCDILQRVASGKFVIDKEDVTGRSGRPAGSTTAIYEVVDGLIVRVWFL